VKPISLSLPAQDVKTADSIRSEKERVLHRVIDEGYLNVEFAAGVCAYFGAVTEVDVNNALVMRFPNGATTFARRVVAGRALWPRTRLRFNVWYTSPVGSTATFSFQGVIWAHDAGGAIAGAGLSVAWTAPGPAVAGTPMKTSAVLTSSPVLSSPREVVRLALGRTDPDTNVNDLDVFLAVAAFEEVA
jgi:hypothetical protein